jgi:hypothetical protein
MLLATFSPLPDPMVPLTCLLLYSRVVQLSVRAKVMVRRWGLCLAS